MGNELPTPWGGASCCLPLFLASIHVPPTPGEWPQHYKEPSVKVKVCFLEKQDWGPNIAMAKGSLPPAFSGGLVAPRRQAGLLLSSPFLLPCSPNCCPWFCPSFPRVPRPRRL